MEEVNSKDEIGNLASGLCAQRCRLDGRRAGLSMNALPLD